ncbi:hypothetical protein F5B22DRAFT_647273 [Xylaria bambusicola]|uniref:uncharacterized protein n=1 Tax=Xylaria bambusicola TaxID=326684 RepID=UPI0020073F05|nr:uncharacterized protein F5B22DRAFT_647273 [Xylaria bambusicola]KAI0514794.1 hypothetical protein F5B22DRAFT_647273 [Xylaria bambusicola]
MDVKDASRTWETLTQRYDTGNEEAQVRIDLIVRLRAIMKEYHEALLLQSEIAKLKRPSKRAHDAYRQWFNKKPYPALGGQAKTFLDDLNDLEELSRDGLHRVGRFNEKSISIAVAVINVLVAAVLLVGSITGLYFVTNDAAKLGMIAAFTAAFALSVGVMTSARRAEIFAATAAQVASPLFGHIKLIES